MKPLTANQRAAAQGKYQSATLIESQLAKVQKALDRIKGTASFGVVGGRLPTKDGESFDAAIATLQPLIRQLTRTPGEGAMSDYESRLAAGILPSRRAWNEETAQQKIDDLRALVQGIKGGYGEMLGAGGASSGVNVARAGAGPHPGAIEGGYRFKGGDPGDPANWEAQ